MQGSTDPAETKIEADKPTDEVVQEAANAEQAAGPEAQTS